MSEGLKQESIRVRMHYELLVTQECFNRCVQSLGTKTLTGQEEQCVGICAQKYAEVRAPLMKRHFAKLKANFEVQE